MSTSNKATTTASDWHRPLRYLYRVPFLIVHAVVLLPLVLLLINPVGAKLSVQGERLDHWAIRKWSVGLLRVFGFRLRRYGTPLPGAALFVANHVSWIDITLLHSQRFVGLVAKSEISHWPLIGWLAYRGGTIFHHRGDNQSLHGVMHQMLQRLESGLSVGVFPEGRTTSGDKIGVFHARIFQPAVLAGVPAQPVALKYGIKGNAQMIIAFAKQESFLQNFLRLLGEPARLAEVHFLEPVGSNEDGRRRMADICRNRIIAAMGQ